MLYSNKYIKSLSVVAYGHVAEGRGAISPNLCDDV